ncbi:hypothetical protein PENARI_c101G05182 [Penicillium arizonense]|uniref:Uncharacterized protein n=1 Tax=Penicillium arizonense TaxID=1835702 RepID=A0A1F5L1N8_PENAI|nr:hypothetical protein PENARI_c101G05182 [Penicillium arizonense]OGE46841.1 hypothetical protein PENARI_c101G05182 [Penicillium arizonense]
MNVLISEGPAVEVVIVDMMVLHLNRSGDHHRINKEYDLSSTLGYKKAYPPE